jgi:hypothetical protein
MDKNLYINPFSAETSRWLFTVSLVLTLFAHSIFEVQRHLQAIVCEKAIVYNQVTVSDDNRMGRTLREKPKVNCELDRMTDDSSPPEKPPSLAEEHPDTEVGICLSSDYSNEAEHLFHPIIIQAANRHQIDPDLVRAIIMAESGYNPKAISNKGARGLMQLMPRTAKALGVKDVFDPEHNINGGVKYFKQLLKQFKGDIKLALAAYNAGSGNVQRYQGVPPFKATKDYVKKVFEYYNYYKALTDGMDTA